MGHKRRRYTRSFDTDTHHVVPSSRFKPGEDPDLNNTVEWCKSFHQAFHYLFHNMAVEEAVAFLRQVSVPGTRWDRRKLHELRRSIIAGNGGEYLTRKPPRRRP